MSQFLYDFFDPPDACERARLERPAQSRWVRGPEGPTTCDRLRPTKTGGAPLSELCERSCRCPRLAIFTLTTLEVEGAPKMYPRSDAARTATCSWPPGSQP